MTDANAIYRETMKIVRERAMVKAAQIPDVMKTRMIVSLNARIAELSKELEELDRGPGVTPAGPARALGKTP